MSLSTIEAQLKAVTHPAQALAPLTQLSNILLMNQGVSVTNMFLEHQNLINNFFLVHCLEL